LAFSFIGTLFLFIAANAWVALLPVYGPIEVVSSNGLENVPMLRGAGTDINMPLALAIVAGLFVEFRALHAHGLDYLKGIFPVHALRRRRLAMGVGSIYLAMLQNIAHVARLFSFTFRLFGALTAGELLRLTISFLTPLLLVIPFYGLEIILGLLQAFVFAGLTLVLMVVAERKVVDPWASSE
ncbi:MAG: F0F1 ATP synthase subunit A, partial [Deltaproteobacteria bacterium]|nr:F0F1 ATP synthase subunit A [Deltaproteobacteria bacterium]